jgi:phosphonate transport system ATP-binding protein
VAKPFVKVEHLTKVYPGGVRALDDVSFEVSRGEFVVVIGLSGSGKSTLLRCINRLVEPTAGRVWIDGVEVTALDREGVRRLRREVGMIFQQFNLVKRLPVLTNVLTGRLGYLPPWWSLVNYWPWRPWTGWGSGRRRGSERTSSPAASSSGWGSPGPSCSSPS